MRFGINVSMINNNIKLLDCTLRDGGYYNNLDFSPDLIKDHLEAMVLIQADYVEIGFRLINNNDLKNGCTFSTDDYLERDCIALTQKIAELEKAA